MHTIRSILHKSLDSQEADLSILSTKFSHWISPFSTQYWERKYDLHFSMNGSSHEIIEIPMNDNCEWNSWQDSLRMIAFKKSKSSVLIPVLRIHKWTTRAEFRVLISDSSESDQMDISYPSSLPIHFYVLSWIPTLRSSIHRNLQRIVSRYHPWWSEIRNTHLLLSGEGRNDLSRIFSIKKRFIQTVPPSSSGIRANW